MKLLIIFIIFYAWTGSISELPTCRTEDVGREDTAKSSSLVVFDIVYDGSSEYETTSITWFTQSGDFTGRADIYTYVWGSSGPTVIYDAYRDVEVVSTTMGSIVKHVVTEPIVLPYGHDEIWIGIRNVMKSGTAEICTPMFGLRERIGYVDWYFPDVDSDGRMLEAGWFTQGQVAAIVEYK